MPHNDKVMNKGKLIVFSAPSGSGKTTIVRHLLTKEDLNLEFSISAATRDPRGEEVNGKDYYFMSIEEFKKHMFDKFGVIWDNLTENEKLKYGLEDMKDDKEDVDYTNLPF